MCWACSYFFKYFVRDVVQNANLGALIRTAFKWAMITLRVIILGVIWLTVPPLLIGCLFEVIVVTPIRTSAIETPKYPFVQCWALGFVVLKIWTRCQLVGAFGDNIWRQRFDRVLMQGLIHLDASFIAKDIIFPITTTLLDFLIVPYFIAKSLCPFFDTYQSQTLIVRYCFCVYVIAKLLLMAVVNAKVALIRLHDEFRDSRYLMGTELTNRFRT